MSKGFILILNFILVLTLINNTIAFGINANNYYIDSDCAQGITNPSNINDGNFDTFASCNLYAGYHFNAYYNYTINSIDSMTFKYLNLNPTGFPGCTANTSVSYYNSTSGNWIDIYESNEIVSGTTNITTILMNNSFIYNNKLALKLNFTQVGCGGNLAFYLYETQVNTSSFIENSQTYSTSTYETTNENFILNFTYDSNAYTSSANFTYNNTVYPSTILTFSSYNLINNNITIPVVSSSGTNKSFYWTIYLTNSTGTYAYNSTINNQTINKGTSLSASTVCPTGTSPAFNFTSFYEQNLTNINISTVSFNINYGLSNSAYTLNSSLSNVDSFSICINDSQSYYNIYYGEIQYSVPGSVDRRYYIFTNTRITNQTVSIPLYTLESISSTSFLFTAQTTTLLPYKGYYIGLLRWYPSLNSYNLVDMGKTDDKGQTILHIQTDTVDYRIGLYQPDGTLIKLLNSVRFICQTNPCTYTVSVDPTPLDLTAYTNIQSSLTFDSATKRFTFTWNDPSQASQTMNLSVFKGDEVVCSTSASGYTGVIICDVSSFTGNLLAQVVRTASPGTIFSQLWAEIKQTMVDIPSGGTLVLFIGAILLILFALIGVYISPILVVILGIVSLIPMFLLGGINMAILTGIIVLGAVVLHFLRRSGGN